MAQGKQDVRAAFPNDKIEFVFFFFQALQQNSDVTSTGKGDFASVSQTKAVFSCNMHV